MKPAREQFKEWMARRGFNLTQAAAYLDWDLTFLSKMVNGSRNPGVANAVKLEDATGIPVRAWVSSEPDTPAEPVLVERRKQR